MAQYTMTLREIIEDNDIFDFEYDFYSDVYKEQFEKKFIDRYLFDEIGVETVGRFKHNLRTMLNEIAPYYTHLYATSLYEYNPILNYDVTETISRDVVSDNKQTNNNNDVGREYDTPVQALGNYKKTPSFINENENNSVSDSKGTIQEVNRRNTSGNIGVMTTQDLIMKERAIIINIDQLILEELSILFMGVY